MTCGVCGQALEEARPFVPAMFTLWEQVPHPVSCPVHPDAKHLELTAAVEDLQRRVGNLETARRNAERQESLKR